MSDTRAISFSNSDPRTASTFDWRTLTSTEEGEMARNRLVISLLILSYFLIESGVNGRVLQTAILTISAFTIFSFAIAAHIIVSPNANHVRRLIAMCADIGTLSFGLYIGEEVTACTWPVYLWIIYGNGFRFGQKYLTISTAIAACCFAAIIMITPFWAEFHNLANGLLFGLVVLPLYARKLINDLSIARERAEEANKTKSLFLASVSHELRTPLNAIIGLSECLTNTRLDSEQNEMLSTIHRSGRTLSHLIENLLDFSRLESGAMPVNIKDIHLPTLVADICALVATRKSNTNVSFNIHVKPGVPVQISTDELKLTQILTNFATNALKFTAEGHVTLSISAKQMDNDVLVLRFDMHDTGIGISAEAQERIFERFTQENEKIVDRYGGTGLGLAIVKQTAALICGKVGVKSTQGEGSSFWLGLPVSRKSVSMLEEKSSPALDIAYFVSDVTIANLKLGGVKIDPNKVLKNYDDLFAANENARNQGLNSIVFTDAETHEVVVDWLKTREDLLTKAVRLTDSTTSKKEVKRIQQTSIAQIPVCSFRTQSQTTIAWIEEVLHQKKKKIAKIAPKTSPASVLVAEDNSANQLVIRKIMDNAGHDFVIVDDGEDVMAELTKRSFDLVLLDLNMPVMNGFETLKFIRFALHDEHIPVIAVTADATVETAERCREAGFDDIVTKPYQAQALLNKIEEHVSTQQRSSDDLENIDELAADDAFLQEEKLWASKGDVEILDLTHLEEIKSMGEPAFFENLVHTFLSECQKNLNALDACSNDDHGSEVKKIAHALKSSALNLGAKRVSLICDELETKVDCSDAIWTKNTLTSLHVAVDECSVALLDQIEIEADIEQPKIAVSYH